jgi:hypothetical protein
LPWGAALFTRFVKGAVVSPTLDSPCAERKIGIGLGIK